MPSANIDSSTDLELRIQPEHDAITLYCKGQIATGDTSLAFRSAVVDLLHRHKEIFVDLSEVRRMDRGGLETLVSLYSSARTARAKVHFVNLTTSISDSPRHSNHVHKMAS